MSGERKAVLGEIAHDRGETPEVGWFIVGEGGYFDVDNACWNEDDPDNAPWTTEHFHLFGTVLDLIAEGPGMAVRYAHAMSNPPGSAAARAAQPTTTEAS